MSNASFPQVNSAVSLDRTREQWVDLGIMEKACITRPETCGAAGGAVSFWIRIVYGGINEPGVISSRANASSTGIESSVSSFWINTYLRYFIIVIVGYIKIKKKQFRGRI